MTGTGLILGEPSSYLLFTIFFSLLTFHFSLPLSFSLLFPLEDSIKEYYYHTLEETKDYEPCAIVFNPRITKHCDLRGEGVEKWSCLRFGRGYLSGVCFALSEMGVEGAGGGVYIRLACKVLLEVWSGGDGASDMRQQARHGEGGMLPATMAVGALQKGAWVAVVRCKGGVGRW
jgi:hypothetical protein